MLFEFSGVELARDGVPILREVTAVVPDQGITVISGASGSGKSSLLRLCNRLEVPTGGHIRFRGEDLLGLEPVALRRRVGMVFQRPTPFPGTCLDNLRAADPGVDESGACRWLERAALDASFLERDALSLSGGEAQRLCLARTLATGCEVVLADEATSALDPGATAILEQLVRDLADSGTAVLWVTHDGPQRDRLGDQRLFMDHGRVVDA